MPRRWQRWLVRGLLAVAGLVVVVALGVVWLAQSDWALKQARTRLIGAVADRVNGTVGIGEIDGSLLGRFTLHDVTVQDSAGTTVLAVDAVRARFSLAALLRQRIVLTGLELVRPRVTLVQRPDGSLNVSDLWIPSPPSGDTLAPGFGSWVRVSRATLRDGEATLRQPWPDAPAPDTARLRAVEVNGRKMVVREIRDLDAELRHLVLADPGAPLSGRLASLSAVARLYDAPPLRVQDLRGRFTLAHDTLRVGGLRLELPSSNVTGEGVVALGSREVEGRIDADVLTRDLLWLRPSLPEDGRLRARIAGTRTAGETRLTVTDLDARLQDARVRGGGVLALGDTFTAGPADVRFEGVDTRLLERLSPGAALPVEGTAAGRVRLDSATAGEALALDADVRFRRRPDGVTSHVTADGRVAFGGDIVLDAVTARFDPLDLSLARDVAPSLTVDGTVTGTVSLDGSVHGRLAVDADVIHNGAATGRSHVLARGGIDLGNGVAARDLVVRMEPLRLALVEALASPLPVGGIVTGRATINGSPGAALSADLDVVHRDTTGVSHVTGSVRLEPGGPGRVLDARLRAPSLALATVGRFIPAAALRGSGSATLVARGPLDRLGVDLDLATPGGGNVALEGSLDAAHPGRRYDLDTRFTAFDAAAFSARAPGTELWGTASVVGAGTDPATLRADIDVTLVDSLSERRARGDVRGGGAQIRARVADGVADIRQADIRVASATASIEGTLGLGPHASGSLHYTLRIDSLSDFAAFVPEDTAARPAPGLRPAIQARRLAIAREDSIRRAQATAVQRAATGRPPEPALEVDTLPPIPSDSLSGSVRLAGTASGGLHRLAAHLGATLEDVVALGYRVGGGKLTLDAEGLALAGPSAPSAQPASPANPRPVGEPAAGRLAVRLDADLDSVQAAGFAFDSLHAHVEHAGGLTEGEGSVRLAIRQDPDRDYRLNAAYELALDRRSVRLDSLALRFDTTYWRSTAPSAITWGRGGVALDHLELVSDHGARIYAEGRLPGEGGSAGEGRAAGEGLVVEIRRLQVAQLIGLVQDTLDATGILDLQARVQGTMSEPRAEATVSLTDATFRGTVLPRIDGSLGWAGGTLESDLTLAASGVHTAAAGTVLATVRGHVDLAGPAGPRRLDLTVRADSLPLESLPSFTDAVSDVRGRVRGDVRVAGTLDDPVLSGAVDLDLGRLDITQPGVPLREVTGRLRLDGTRLFLDSLTALSGGGRTRVAGTVELDGENGPAADLQLRAEDALVMNNDLAENLHADADLHLFGPISSLAVTGTARVRGGIIHVPLDRGNALDLSGAEAQTAIAASDVVKRAVPPHNSVLQGLRADVSLRVDRNTWVRALDGTVEIYTPDDGAPLAIRYSGARGLPVLDGVVHAERGEWTFAGKRFELTTGTATFLQTAELDPQLQLTAVHDVVRPGQDPLEIQITVGGHLQQPVVTLSSNAQPPLSQTDLISFLVFGSASGSIMPASGSGLAGGSAGQLGALASQQLASVALGSLFQRTFQGVEARPGRYGLDVLRISATELPDELAFDSYFQNVLRGTQVEAGKYLTPQLFVAARGRTTTEAWPGLRAEYRTPSGFRLTSSWEPRYLPLLPTLGTSQTADQTRALSLFLFKKWRY